MTHEVLLYARLSVTTEDPVSIVRQLESGRQYAESRGWTVAGEFTDDGVSASKIKPEARPGWRALLAATAEQKPHAVVVWKVDRLAHRVLDFLNADSALQEHGSGLVCVADPVDMTTPQGRAFATVLAVFAELEAASISARVKDARKALLAAGRRGGGRPPYGWMNAENPDGPGVVLAQDPERIGYVSELAALALRGDSIYSLARYLDSSGAPKRPHKNRKSPHWSENVVEGLLRNPVLAGLTPYQSGRKPGEEPDPWAVVRDNDGVPIADESVAIVSVEERRRLLEVLDSLKKPGSRPQHARNPALLSRLLRCGSCGKTMHRSRTANKYDSYRCQNRECEGQVTVDRARVENYVATCALAERGEGWRVAFRTVGPDEGELALIEQALREAGAELAATDDDAAAEALLARITTLKSRRADARRGPMKKVVTPIRAATWGHEFRAAQAADDVPEQQRLIREVIQFVSVKRVGKAVAHTPIEERVSIRWEPPAEGAELIA